MELDEYLWRNGILKKTFAEKIGMIPHAFCRVVNKKVTPKLVTALNIIKLTDGQVTFRELVRDEDLHRLL